MHLFLSVCVAVTHICTRTHIYIYIFPKQLLALIGVLTCVVRYYPRWRLPAAQRSCESYIRWALWWGPPYPEIILDDVVGDCVDDDSCLS